VLVILIPFELGIMESHLNAQTDALAGIIAALGFPSAAGLPDAHDAQRLDGRQGMVIPRFPKQALCLAEKSVAGRVGPVRLSTEPWVVRQTGREGEQRIDQKGRAKPRPPRREISQEVFSAQ